MRYPKNLFSRNTNIDIFSLSATDIDPVKYYIHIYGEVPNHYASYFRVNLTESLSRLKKKMKLTNSDFISKREYSKDSDIYRVDKESSAYLIHIQEEIIMFITNYKAIFFYGSSIKFFEIKNIIKLLDPSEQKKLSQKPYFSLINFSSDTESGYELRNFNLKPNNLIIEKNYNNDFIPMNKKIVNFINNNNETGLVLLHGKYGTGKTSYIKHLISQTKKRFILLPQSMLETISNPSFFLFIADYKDSILIFEDCDNLLVNTSTKNNPLMHFLNLAEGLLSDTYVYKIICSLSASSRQINENVIRKSKLIVNYEFKELSTEKAQKLSNDFGSDEVINKPTILAEIYNKKNKDLNNFKDKKMGFNT